MVMPPRESIIRRHLADRLEMLEPGLRLFRQEYWIPNPEGTGGYIDILARDRHQNWVVIELKRANNTARETAQELAKYVELLRREKGVLPGRIRVFAVALEPQWNELLTPLSNLARDWDHDLRGYRLTIDRDGVPQSAHRIEFLAPPAERRLTSIHVIFEFVTTAERDQCWDKVVHSAAQAGAIDLIGVHLDYGGPSGEIMYPHALYLAFGQIHSLAQLYDDHPCTRFCDHPLLDSEERAEYEHPDVYDALTHVCSTIRAGAIENGSPARFAQLTQQDGWTIEHIHRAGAFSHDTYQDKDDIIRLLTGRDGEPTTLFVGTASSKTPGPWREFRQSTMICLATNRDWTELVGAWLDRIAELPGEYDVGLHIYNPCDIITTFVHGLPADLRKFQPFILGVAEPRDSSSARQVIRGGLRWNGTRVPDLLGYTHVIYRDVFSWHAARYGGIAHEADRELLQLWGMRHLVEEITIPPQQHSTQEPHVTVRFPSTTTPDELSEWTAVHTLEDFVSQHLHQVWLLVREYSGRL
ncbi:endonuclease NucS domain-containing protein [Nocardia cyriacigeorgica]|uniref:Protein of uncharacterized function DUF91 n=1 Tax=Nocardia cyriacigeorgica TaxID=135487 RepID=A0A4U8VSY9_9NOCA|nr:endonuclease NucS domain-containing protein [Nocardia cyriacigeorgica]VFA96342.1 Protein of uncharacterised function DUF91 [Nocardia cyriacigeorgica]